MQNAEWKMQNKCKNATHFIYLIKRISEKFNHNFAFCILHFAFKKGDFL